MAEYGMRQRNKLCKIITNNPEATQPAQTFADNRTQFLLQNSIINNIRTKEYSNLGRTTKNVNFLKNTTIQRFDDQKKIKDQHIEGALCTILNNFEKQKQMKYDETTLPNQRSTVDYLKNKINEKTIEKIVEEYKPDNNHNSLTLRLLAEFVARDPQIAKLLDKRNVKQQVETCDEITSEKQLINENLYHHVTALTNKDNIFNNGLQPRTPTLNVPNLNNQFTGDQNTKETFKRWSLGYTFVTQNDSEINGYSEQYTQNKLNPVDAIVLDVLIMDKGNLHHDPDSKYGYKHRGKLSCIGDKVNLNKEAQETLAEQLKVSAEDTNKLYKSISGGRLDIRTKSDSKPAYNLNSEKGNNNHSSLTVENNQKPLMTELDKEIQKFGKVKWKIKISSEKEITKKANTLNNKYNDLKHSIGRSELTEDNKNKLYGKLDESKRLLMKDLELHLENPKNKTGKKLNIIKIKSILIIILLCIIMFIAIHLTSSYLDLKQKKP